MTTKAMEIGGRDGVRAARAAAARRVPLPVRAAQLLLLGPLGALVVFGSVYFSAIAPPVDVDAVGAWAFAQGAAAIVVGARLGRGGQRVRRAAIAIVALHVVFGAVKVLGYDEAEAATFIALDVVALALLSSPSARKLTVS